MNKLGSALISVVCAFLVFSPSFLTSMHGDEWKVLWLAKQALLIKGSYMPVNAWDTPYLFEHITLDLLARIFPIYSGWFYFISFVIRMITALFIFRLVKTLTNSRISGYVASFLFAISSIGVEAVIWVRNYSAYVSLIIFLILYIKYIFTEKINTIAIVMGFILILLVNTTRSHGFLFLFFVLMAPLIKTPTMFKKVFLTLLIIITIFLAVSLSPYFGGQAKNLLSEEFNIKMFLVSTLGNFGRVFVSGPTYIKTFFIVTLTLFLCWKSYYTKFKNGLFFWLAFLFFGLSCYIYGFTVMTEHYLSALFGTYFLILLIISSLFEFLFKIKDLKKTLLVFGFGLGFLLIPMIRQPQVHMGSDHRYLIHSAIVIPLIAAFSIKNHYKISLLAICIACFIFASQNFALLQIHKVAHSTQYTSLVWNILEKNLKKEYIEDENYKIYLVSDAENYSRVNASVYFDFPYHAGLLFDVWDENKLPLNNRLFMINETQEELILQKRGNHTLVIIKFI